MVVICHDTWTSLPAFLICSLVLFANAAECMRDLVMILKRQACGSGLEEEQCVGDGLAACVDLLCTNCASFSPVIPQCCAGKDPIAILGCLQKGLQGGLDTSSDQAIQQGTSTPSAPVTPTSAPSQSALSATLTGDPNLIACDQFQLLAKRCESRTPGFSDLPGFATKASCLCYSSQTYQGSIYDGYYSSCLDYITTADLARYSSLAEAADGSITSSPCSALVQGDSSPAKPTSATKTSASSQQSGGPFLRNSASPSQTAAPTTASPTQPGLTTGTPSSQAGGQATFKVTWCGERGDNFR
jgi:hypothetical protein